METKFICKECDWHGTESQVLKAPNPFANDDTEIMFGCPDCREPNNLRRGCDEPGCNHEATCGTPSPAGYRVVCGEHFRAVQRLKTAK